MKKLPWNHNYKVTVSLRSTAVTSESINPSLIYNEEEWNNLSRGEQEDWLNDETEALALTFIEYDWCEP